MMGSSYQIVLLGTPFWIEELINSFSEYPMIEIKEWKNVDSNLPVLYLYYGSTNKDAESPSGIKLEDLVSRQDILPIVKDLNYLGKSFLKNCPQLTHLNCREQKIYLN